jgi:hypothetical protein
MADADATAVESRIEQMCLAFEQEKDHLRGRWA